MIQASTLRLVASADIRGTSGRLLAVLVPDPIGPLVCKNLFSTLLLMGRSVGIDVVFPTDVPPQEWVLASKPWNLRASRVPLEPGGFQNAVDVLRAWGPLIPDKDRLNIVISHLDNVKATLERTAQLSPKQRAGRDVKHALMLTYLKSSKSMQDFTGDILDMVLPGTRQQADLMGSVSQAQRNQFLVDLAYMLIARREFQALSDQIRLG